jgi:hypothetical protein
MIAARIASPTEVELAGINSSGEPTSQETTPVPYLAGTGIIPASWLTPTLNQRNTPAPSAGGKSSKSGGGSGQWNYNGTIAGLWCHGPVTAKTGVIVDDKLVWEGRLNAATSPNPVEITIPGYGLERFYWGLYNQITVDPKLTPTGNKLGQNHPAYRAQSYSVYDDIFYGTGREESPTLKQRLERAPLQSLITGAAAELDDGQANPFAVFIELAMSAYCGLAMPAAYFSQAKLQAAADLAYARRDLWYVSVLLDTQSSLKGLLGDMFDLCDAFLRAETGTGLIEAGLFTQPEDINPEFLPVIDYTMLDTASEPEINPQSWSEVDNVIEATFRDREYNFKERGARFPNPVGLRRRRGISTKKYSWDIITRSSQVINMITRKSRRTCRTGGKATLDVRGWRLPKIYSGLHVRCDIDPEPGGIELHQVCRVTGVTEQPNGLKKVELEYEPTIAPILAQPTLTPAPVTTVEIPEIPYVRFFELPNALADAAYQLGILAAKPDDLAYEFAAYFDISAGGAFPQIGTANNWAVRAQVSTSFAAASAGPFDVTLVETKSASLIAADPGDWAAANDTLLMLVFKIANGGQIAADGSGKAWLEIFSVSDFTSTGANRLNVAALRGRTDTSTHDFAVGDEVWFIPRSDLPIVAQLGFEQAQKTNARLYFKLQPAHLRASRLLEDCAIRTFSYAPQRDDFWGGQRAGLFPTGSSVYNKDYGTSSRFKSEALVKGSLGVTGLNGNTTDAFWLTTLYGWATGTGFGADRFGKADMIFEGMMTANFTMSGGTNCIVQMIYRVNGGAAQPLGAPATANFNIPFCSCPGAQEVNLSGTDVVDFGLAFAHGSSIGLANANLTIKCFNQS